MLLSVRRVEYSLTECTIHCSILYMWGPSWLTGPHPTYYSDLIHTNDVYGHHPAILSAEKKGLKKHCLNFCRWFVSQHFKTHN